MDPALKAPFCLHQGDCLEVLRSLPAESVDSVVTDPPAGISFMGKDWDSAKGGRAQWVSWMTDVMRECLRVLKPGGHALVWAIPRTSHWTGAALEDAGFEIRDVVTHLFGSGFPKSLDVSKAIDKAAGAEREVTGRTKTPYKLAAAGGNTGAMSDLGKQSVDEDGYRYTEHTAPATPDALKWQGFGTALKPAVEFWWLCRKPLSEKTVAQNVLKWGTGGLNIDGCRIGSSPDDPNLRFNEVEHKGDGTWLRKTQTSPHSTGSQGRFPANLVLTCCGNEPHDEDCAVRMLDEQSGTLKSGGGDKGNRPGVKGVFGRSADVGFSHEYVPDSGGASRFFYVAKASKSDRNRKAR